MWAISRTCKPVHLWIYWLTKSCCGGHLSAAGCGSCIMFLVISLLWLGVFLLLIIVGPQMLETNFFQVVLERDFGNRYCVSDKSAGSCGKLQFSEDPQGNHTVWTLVWMLTKAKGWEICTTEDAKEEEAPLPGKLKLICNITSPAWLSHLPDCHLLQLAAELLPLESSETDIQFWAQREKSSESLLDWHSRTIKPWIHCQKSCDQIFYLLRPAWTVSLLSKADPRLTISARIGSSPCEDYTASSPKAECGKEWPMESWKLVACPWILHARLFAISAKAKEPKEGKGWHMCILSQFYFSSHLPKSGKMRLVFIGQKKL